MRKIMNYDNTRTIYLLVLYYNRKFLIFKIFYYYYYYLYVYIIVYLVYISFYCVFLSRGGRCTLSPLLCPLGAIVLPSPRSTFGGWWWWAGVCVGLGCRWGGLVV